MVKPPKTAASAGAAAAARRQARQSHQPPPQERQQPQPKQKKNASCLICKFRRVKCDGARPSCNQCRQVKRVCAGYPDDPKRGGPSSVASSSSASSSATTRPSTAALAPLTRVTGIAEVEEEEGDENEEDFSSFSLALRTPPRTPEPEDRIQESATEESTADQSSASLAPTFRSGLPTAPLHARPTNTTPEDPLLHMYRVRTMPALHPSQAPGICHDWRRYILQGVNSDTTLRYVASSLATYHDNYLAASPSSSMLASKYYSKGLSSMVASYSHKPLSSTDLVHLMMSASVLLGIEFFRRNFGAIKVHLESVVKVLGERPTSEMTDSLHLAERFFRRAYLYFTFFPDLYPTFTTLTRDQIRYRCSIPDIPESFVDMREAEYYLHELFWMWMFFFQSLEKDPKLVADPNIVKERDSLLAGFSNWSQRFQMFLSDSESHIETAVRLQADIEMIWVQMVVLRLMTALTPLQCALDATLPQLRLMLTLLRDANSRQAEDSRIVLEPVLGYLTPTFWLMVHCRDPMIRRSTLAMVRGLKHTHAQWFPPSLVRAGWRVVNIEEEGWEARIREEKGQRSAVPKRVVTEASEIKEEDRLRKVRIHTDFAKGMVELGYVCWNGEIGGWQEKREKLSLNFGAG